MLNFIWFHLIIMILLFSFVLNKFICFENYNIKKILSSLIKSKNGLFLTLGTKIGVGSIVGTAAAIHTGGVGSVFWMFLFSILTSSVVYFESLLGSKYKKKIENDNVGGPYFYIKYGLNNHKAAVLSTFLLIVCYSFFFQMLQTNTVASLVMLNSSISIWVISLLFMFLLLFTVFFSIKELLNLLNKIVPVMCLIFLSICFYVIIKNHDILFILTKNIIIDAFSLKGLLVGALIGIKRSVFLNELLIGTTSIASSVDKCDEYSSARTQVFGAYFITFVLALFITLLILIYTYYNNVSFSSYNELINQVFIFHYGKYGGLILIILITLLAVSTIVSGFYIGLSNLKYITKNKVIIFIFKIFVISFTISGLYLNANKIWEFIDIIMIILMIINMISIVKIFRREINDRK